MNAHLADQICLFAAAIVPVPLIILFRWWGVAMGTLAVWVILWAAGEWIAALDPTRGNRGGDSLWILFGWIGGLIYCLPIFGVRELVAWMVRSYWRSRRAA